MNEDELRRMKKAPGAIVGTPIPIDPKGTFTVKLPVPPLKEPSVEILLEGMVVKDASGKTVETAWRSTPAGDTVQVGSVAIQLARLSAVGETREGAAKKLATLIGQAMAQVYVDLVTSDDEEKIEAARTMERNA